MGKILLIMKEQLIQSIDALGYLLQKNDTKGELQIELLNLHDMIKGMEECEDFVELIDLHLQAVYYVRRSILNI